MPRFFLKCQNGVMTHEISLNFVVGWSENSLFVGSFIHVMNHNRVLLVIYPAQSIEKGTNPRLIFVKGHQGVSHLPCVSFPPLASSTYSSKASSSSSSWRKLPRGPYIIFILLFDRTDHAPLVPSAKWCSVPFGHSEDVERNATGSSSGSHFIGQWLNQRFAQVRSMNNAN